MNASNLDQPADAVAAGSRSELEVTVFWAAWLAVLLGIGMETLLLVVKIALGAVPTLKVFTGGVAQNLSWSFLVCVGLAFAKASGIKPAKATMALAGLLVGPVAFMVAKSVQQGVLAALGTAGTAGAPPVILLASIKAIEYAVLGYGLVWLPKHKGAGVSTYVAVGIMIGVVFGTLLLMVTARESNPMPPTANLVAQGVNDILHPVGCSLVLFASGVWAKRSAHGPDAAAHSAEA